MVDRDCHKSHHYGFVLAGSSPCYLDAYPLHRFSMYGGVPLQEIKKTLLAYRAAKRLNEVKLLVLTNCTFDGIVYNVKRVIEECLAIKPDLIFLFDEAWFSYATFHPILKKRTAMNAANEIRRWVGTSVSLSERRRRKKERTRGKETRERDQTLGATVDLFSL